MDAEQKSALEEIESLIKEIEEEERLLQNLKDELSIRQDAYRYKWGVYAPERKS